MRIHCLPLLLFAVVGCGDIQPTADAPGVTARDSSLALASGDVRIVTKDGEFEMILVGTRVLMRLSDQAVAKVRADMAPAEAAEGGVGGWIESTVKGKVGSRSAMGGFERAEAERFVAAVRAAKERT